MSAIYQRARPIRWEDVVGQEHIKGVLQGTLAAGKIGHAYVFSGPRGVGKTTVARLIAMTANCQAEQKPCGECEHCLNVRRGSHPDVLEIDAASNNSVDDVRELREKISLSPMYGGKKIYILDEAHMMSRGAFNALLKTLEEPPAHTIFILATTEPDKILPTILSRCQHYRFRRLRAEEIASKLEGLVQKEGAYAEASALELLGKLADGAMRDGESLLERMLAVGGQITRAGVEEALGLPPHERLHGLAQALVKEETASVMEIAAQLYWEGFSARSVITGLVGTLSAAIHAELKLQSTGQLQEVTLDQLLRLQTVLDEQESRFVRSADLQSLQLALSHGLLSLAQPSTAPSLASSGYLEQRITELENKIQQITTRQIEQPARAPKVVSAPNPTPSVVPVVSPPTTQTKALWDAFLKAIVTISGQHLKAFVKEARYEIQDDVMHLIFDKINQKGVPQNRFHGQQVIKEIEQVARAVQQVFAVNTVQVSCFGEVKTHSLTGFSVAPVAVPVEKPASPPVASRPVTPPSHEIPDFEPQRTPPKAAPIQPIPSPELVEPELITEEPIWDLPPLDEPKKSVEQSPPAPQKLRPAKKEDAPQTSVSTEATSSLLQHPLYQEISQRFPGQVREINEKKET